MTRIKTLTPDDKNAIESLLRSRLETSVLMLGQLQHPGSGRDTAEACPFDYAGVFSAQRLQGVAAHDANGFVLLQADDSINELFLHLVRSSSRPVKGILGPTTQVKTLLHSLQIPDGSLQLLSHDRLYQLPLAQLRLPSRLTSGHYTARLLETRDLETLAQWKRDYAVETLKQRRADLSPDQFAAEARRALTTGRTWVLEEKNTLLSTCTVTAMADEVIQVGLLWTPRDLRSREYGRCVLAACLYDAWLKSIRSATVFFSAKNQPATHLCRALGFEPAGEYSLVLFRHTLTIEAQPVEN